MVGKRKCADGWVSDPIWVSNYTKLVFVVWTMNDRIGKVFKVFFGGTFLGEVYRFCRRQMELRALWNGKS